MFLDPGDFNDHLEHMGQQVTWRKASACPCRNPDSGAPDSRCPHCGGKGQMWAEAVDSVVGIASSRTQKEWVTFGQFESGDTVVVVPENSPLYEMGQFDRVALLNANEQFSIPLQRGKPTERLHGRIEAVTRVFWLDAQKRIVDGGIPTVDGNGMLTWSAGAPPAGQQFTINGTRFLEYFCWGAFPSSRNQHQGFRLPKRVVLRRFDLLGRGAKSSA